MQERKLQPHIRDELKRKSKIERDQETVKPTSINDGLIQEYLHQYNKENKIFDDRSHIWELKHLSLSFRSKSHHMIFICNVLNVHCRHRRNRQLGWHGEIDEVTAGQQYHHQD